MKNIINIVNFIRGCEPREKMDLLEPVAKQIELAEKYNLPTTFLFQYDALISPEFTDLVKDCDEKYEFGLWLEIPKPLVEKVGLKWRGREGFAWDWYSHVGMLVGYTVDERKKLIDECMRYFNNIFGYYPKTVGCWSLDGFSLDYLDKAYGIDAALICKEQWGTDGYSLWGGYYSEAYYPTRNNIFCPAENLENQINIPVFRMLGSDPIDQYMNGLGSVWQNVETLEPCCPVGRDPNWINLYLNTYFDNNNIGMNYVQAGQENSFGWRRMSQGLTIQYEIFAQKRAKGEIEVMNSGDIGRIFKKMYSLTPCTTTVARKENRGTAWFNNKNYRASLYLKDDLLLLRDLHIFNDGYRERYYDEVATNESLYFDNLPFIDCYRWSKDGNIGGGYFVKDGKTVKLNGEFKTENIDENRLKVIIPTDFGDITVTFLEDKVEFIFPDYEFSFEARIFNDQYAPTVNSNGCSVNLSYREFAYFVETDGITETTNNGFKIKAKGKALTLKIK